jgi:hypothetical protein
MTRRLAFQPLCTAAFNSGRSRLAITSRWLQCAFSNRTTWHCFFPGNQFIDVQTKMGVSSNSEAERSLSEGLRSV